MVRTALAVVLGSLLFTATSASATDEVAPLGGLIASAGSANSSSRLNTDLGSASLLAAAAPAAVNGISSTGPRRPAPLMSLYVGLAALQAYDVYSTSAALRKGGSEANPMMSGVVAHPAAFIALKAGMTGMSILSAERMWRQHHRARAIAVMAVSNGFMALVAAHNASVVARR